MPYILGGGFVVVVLAAAIGILGEVAGVLTGVLLIIWGCLVWPVTIVGSIGLIAVGIFAILGAFGIIDI